MATTIDSNRNEEEPHENENISVQATQVGLRLKRAFQVSLCLTVLSIVFLFLAFVCPQFLLGKSPSMSNKYSQSNYIGLAEFYNELEILNHQTNLNVLKNVAETAFWITGYTSFGLWFCMKSRAIVMASASFIYSFGGLVFGPFLIISFVLGLIALTQIKKSKAALSGKGFAVAGIVISGVCLVVLLALQIAILNSFNSAAAELSR